MACEEKLSCSALQQDLAEGKGLSSSCKASEGVPDAGQNVEVQKKYGEKCTCSGGANLCRGTLGPCENNAWCFNGTCHGKECDITKGGCGDDKLTCDLIGKSTGYCMDAKKP
jgi:hypothetical protein